MIAEKRENGKVAAPRFDLIKFQYNPSIKSTDYKTKDDMVRVFKKDENRDNWVLEKGTDNLIKRVNETYTIQFGINTTSTKVDDIESFDGFFIDYDGWDKENNCPIDGIATIEEILDLPTIKQYCVFYQLSFSNRLDALSAHFFFLLDKKTKNLVEYQISGLFTLQMLTHELGNRPGFDVSVNKNPGQVCFAGKSQCVMVNPLALIPFDDFVNEAKELGITPTHTTAQRQAKRDGVEPPKLSLKKEPPKNLEPKKTTPTTTTDSTTTDDVTEKVLAYINTEIVKGKLEGNWMNLYCLYEHNWQHDNPEEAIQSVCGSNPFSTTNKSGRSFKLSLVDENLPAIWYDRSNNVEIDRGNKISNGGNFLEYWYRIQRLEGLYQQGGFKANFKKIVSDICNHFHVASFPFKSKSDDDDDKSKRQKLYEKITKLFEARIRFNEMTLQPEMDNVEIDFDIIPSKFDIEYGICAGREMLTEILMYIAKQNSYQPVRDYLDEVSEKYPYTPESISNLSSKYFGTTEPIYDIYVKKTLIAAVARVFDPGCQVKTMLTLTGKQDVGKSTWIRKLAGHQWFNDGIKITDFGDKDDKLIINSYWIHEIDEIDKITRKTDRANLKSTLSSPSDNFRAPYGRKVSSHPRSSIFIATSNETDILSDPTGSVRFWCLPVKTNNIDFELLTFEREKLWANAVHAYRAGEQYWLSKEEEKMRDESNQQFETEDAIESLILPKIRSKHHILIADELIKLQMKPEDNGLSMRVANILKKYGWLKERRTFDGVRGTYWINPKPIDETLESKSLNDF